MLDNIRVTINTVNDQVRLNINDPAMGAAKISADAGNIIERKTDGLFAPTPAWDALEDKPVSTVNDIDQAVGDRHTHANKSVIDDLSDNAGALEYRGLPVSDQAALDAKVDKVAGYSLVADDEIAKLSTVEQVVQDAAQQAASAVIAGVDGQVDVAQSAADRAETASEVAMSAGWVYATVAEGRAARTDGDFFWVVSADGREALELWLMGATTATDTGKRTVSAQHVLKPIETGLKIGWADTFFRQFDDVWPVSYFGRNRKAFYYPDQTDIWTIEPSSIFQGNTLRKSDNGYLSTFFGAGFVTYLDEIGAEEGDTVTAKALVRASAGSFADGNGRIHIQFYNDGGIQVGSLLTKFVFGFNVNQNPRAAFHSATVPAGADYFVTWYTKDNAADLLLDAFWSHKGDETASPDWPRFNNDPWTDALANYNKNQFDINFDPVKEDAEYAVKRSSVVVFDSETTELAVTGAQVSTTYGSPFTGWGEEYAVTAGLEFNAVEVKRVGRKSDVAEANYWSTLGVQVRTAATDARSGTIVAVGTIEVDPNDAVLENVKVILRDPNTNEPITLNEANLDAEYFVGVFVRNASGGAAYMSPHRAEQSNSLGQTYYGESTASNGGNFTQLFSSNWRVGVDHLLLVNPREEIVRAPTDQFKQDVVSDLPVQDPFRQNSAVWGEWNMRNYESKLTQLASDELVIAFIGDSWTNSGHRIVEPIRAWLDVEYGISAFGYISVHASSGNPGTIAYVVKTRTGTWSDSSYSGTLYAPDGATSATTDLTATFSLTPSTTVTKYIIHYLQKPDGGTLTYKLGSGGTPVSVDTNGTLEYKTVEVTANSETLIIEISAAGVEGVTLAGVDVRNDTNGKAVVHKLGYGGGTASRVLQIDEAAFATAYTALAPDVVFITFGTNEMSGNVAPQTMSANIEAIADRLLAVNPLVDIVIIGAGPNGLAGKVYTIEQYNDALYQLARTRDWSFLDLQRFFGSYDDANSRGLYEDSVHPNQSGGRVIGRAIIKNLLSTLR